MIASFESGERKGAYWMIRTDMAEYAMGDDPAVSLSTFDAAQASPGLVEGLKNDLEDLHPAPTRQL